MKKIPLYDVPVGKTFVFHHRMYRRIGSFAPEGYILLDVPCIMVGVVHNNVKHYFYRCTKVEV